MADLALIIEELKKQFDLLFLNEDQFLPKALLECKTEEEWRTYLEKILEDEDAFLNQICEHYSLTLKIQTQLSREQIWLLQARFGEALLLCYALSQPIPCVQDSQILSPTLNDTDLLHWLLVPYWDVHGFLIWTHQQRAKFRNRHG